MLAQLRTIAKQSVLRLSYEELEKFVRGSSAPAIKYQNSASSSLIVSSRQWLSFVGKTEKKSDPMSTELLISA